MSNIAGIIASIRKIMWQDTGLNGDAQRIEQLGWMLFLKIFSDKDLEMELMNSKYKSPIPAEFHWVKEKGNWAGDDEGMTGDTLLEFVDRKLFPALRNLNVSTGNRRALIVREVFEGNNNYMKSGINIRKVLNKLNEIDFNVAKDRHAFGELYENILKELQSAGKSGEFYTPRAVTQFITDIINPKEGEKILDPACGTGGFLTCAIEILKKKANSVEARKALQENVNGWEYKPLPYLLATTNLILHDIEVPNIRFGDALDQPLSNYTDKHRVDVIIANPPFGGIVANNNENNFPQSYRTKESADLFLILMIHLLKHGGRAGIVLPDGSLEGEGVKQRIRQRLLEECNLHTIIRLPNSVFKPYAIVPTNLLFFEKGKQTKEVWYYEHTMPAGYKSYSKTRPIQLKEFDVIKKWWNNRNEHEFAWKVSIEKIIERGYDLNIKNPNRVVEELVAPEIILKKKDKAEEEFQEKVNQLINEFKHFHCNGELSFINENLSQLLKATESITAIKSLIQNLAVRGKLIEQNSEDEPASQLIKKIKEWREKQIKERKLNKEKALLPVSSDEKVFDTPKNWATCRLGEIVTMVYGSSLTKAETKPNAPYPVFGSNGIVGYYDTFLTEKRTIIIGRKGSSGALIRCDSPSWTTDVAYYIEENEFLNYDFLFYLLKTLNLESLGKGIKPGLNRNEAYNLVISVPPLNEQIRIIKKLEQLMKLCDEIQQTIEQNQNHTDLLLQSALKYALQPKEVEIA